MWSNCEGSNVDRRCPCLISQQVSPCLSSEQNLCVTLGNLTRCSHSNLSRQASPYSMNPKLNKFALSRSRFCNHSLIFSSLMAFLHLPLRHGSRIVNLAEITANKIGIAHKRNSVGAGYMSHRRTSAINHLDYCFIVFNFSKQCIEVTKFCVWSDTINLLSSQNLPTCQTTSSLFR